MDKTMFKSKTFWGCALGILGVVGFVIRGEMALEVAIPAALAFFTAFGIRDAL